MPRHHGHLSPTHLRHHRQLSSDIHTRRGAAGTESRAGARPRSRIEQRPAPDSREPRQRCPTCRAAGERAGRRGRQRRRRCRPPRTQRFPAAPQRQWPTGHAENRTWTLNCSPRNRQVPTVGLPIPTSRLPPRAGNRQGADTTTDRSCPMCDAHRVTPTGAPVGHWVRQSAAGARLPVMPKIVQLPIKHYTCLFLLWLRRGRRFLASGGRQPPDQPRRARSGRAGVEHALQRGLLRRLQRQAPAVLHGGSTFCCRYTGPPTARGCHVDGSWSPLAW